MTTKTITFAMAAATTIADDETRVRIGQNKPRMVADYKDRLKHCLPFFGSMPITKIDARKLREFRDVLAQKNLKATSIAAILSFVSMVQDGEGPHPRGVVRPL